MNENNANNWIKWDMTNKFQKSAKKTPKSDRFAGNPLQLLRISSHECFSNGSIKQKRGYYQTQSTNFYYSDKNQTDKGGIIPSRRSTLLEEQHSWWFLRKKETLSFIIWFLVLC